VVNARFERLDVEGDDVQLEWIEGAT